MKLLLKTALLIVIAFIVTLTVYIIFSTDENSEGTNDKPLDQDTIPPSIDTITRDTTAIAGKIITIYISFSDNVKVTEAILYYRKASDVNWNTLSIINGSADIDIPQDPIEDWYYYVTVNDDANNGPVGDPSDDGSIYYTIKVLADNQDIIHYVFIEEATATWCDKCPAVSDILYDLYNSEEYNFYYVSMVADKNEKAEDRLEKDYNKYAYPSVFIDGGYEVIVGGSTSKSDIEEKILKATQRNVPRINIKVSAEIDENGSKLKSTVMIENFEDNIYSGRLKVHLTERVSWPNFDGKSYHFGFLDYILNEDITISANNQIMVEKNYDVTNFDADNLMIIAVVFNSESTTRYANPPDGNRFDAYYADATDGTPVVKEPNLPPEIGITNPKEGYLHLFGNALLATINFKTILLGRTTITAQANDDSKIEKVEFYIDNELVASITSEPYEWKWKGLTLFEQHTIKVIAYDDEGKTKAATRDVLVFILF